MISPSLSLCFAMCCRAQLCPNLGILDVSSLKTSTAAVTVTGLALMVRCRLFVGCLFSSLNPALTADASFLFVSFVVRPDSQSLRC